MCTYSCVGNAALEDLGAVDRQATGTWHAPEAEGGVWQRAGGGSTHMVVVSMHEYAWAPYVNTMYTTCLHMVLSDNCWCILLFDGCKWW
jgi:hypothetical protein